jgi:hypothetical protein
MSDLDFELIILPLLEDSAAVSSIHHLIIANDDAWNWVSGQNAHNECHPLRNRPYKVSVAIKHLHRFVSIITWHVLSASKCIKIVLNGLGDMSDNHCSHYEFTSSQIIVGALYTPQILNSVFSLLGEFGG